MGTHIKLRFDKPPTPEQIEQTLARLGKPDSSAYFFDQLNNPLRFERLAK